MQKVAIGVLVCLLSATTALCWEEESKAADAALAKKNQTWAARERCEQEMAQRRKRAQDCIPLHEEAMAAARKWLDAVEAERLAIMKSVKK